jgi:BirA family biotin operon repressor/biotin-[acetyl-CoA-carboxylase] ligase
VNGAAIRLPPGHRLEVFAELDSTMDEARRRAAAGDPGRLWLLARRQSAGRGRRGRAWVSGAGNLMASLLLRPGCNAAEGAQRSFASARAVAEALAPFLPAGAAIALKWPNDVLLEGAKLAGVLIDAAPDGPRFAWLVVGLGMNLMEAPEIPGRRTVALSHYGAQVEPQVAAELLLNRLGFWLEALEQNGQAAVLQEWQKRAHPPGSLLSVLSSGRMASGRYAGLAPTGELLLEVEHRIERFATGEIFHMDEG